MTADDITIIPLRLWTKMQDGRLRHFVARVYYYQGNVYGPMVTDLVSNVGFYRRSVRTWLNRNRELVERDRADPEYRTLTQIFDEQTGGIHGPTDHPDEQGRGPQGVPRVPARCQGPA